MKKSPSTDGRVRNTTGWRQHLARFRGDAVQFDLGRYDAAHAEIDRAGYVVGALSDQELQRRARELRDRAQECDRDQSP